MIDQCKTELKAKTNTQRAKSKFAETKDMGIELTGSYLARELVIFST